MRFEEAILPYSGQPLTRQIILDLLKDYRRPFDKISDLVQQKILIPVKRGFFIPGPALHISPPEPYLLANHMKGPSYISMESALFHKGIIPELVYEISSVTTGRSATYHTDAGRFSYTHLPLPYYSFGQQQIKLAEKQIVLMACAEKAICDKIVATSGLLIRSTVQMKAWLTEDMRMDKGLLRTLDLRMMRSWLKAAPKKNTLQQLVKTLEDL